MTRRGRIRAAACLAILAIAGAGAVALAGDDAAGPNDRRVVLLVRAAAQPLSGNARDYAPLLRIVGDAQFVLLGEQTHGTHEFYRERARITRRLIQEKGFTAVALEADWTDARRLDRYVTARAGDAGVDAALAAFDRFPRWMWRNAEVRQLVRWLRAYNESLPAGAPRVRVFGLDLYGFFESADAVVRYLAKTDPAAAVRARSRYRCFTRFHDADAYGRATVDMRASCKRQASDQLRELDLLYRQAASRTPPVAENEADELLDAVQNARVVKAAEEFYRAQYSASTSTWNVRDRHMADALDAVAAPPPPQTGARKVVVWAHNSHVGDARATTLGEVGEWNIGQLVRQRHPHAAVLVGFTTYTGTVIAATDWGKPGRRMYVRPGMPGTYSALFHQARRGNFVLALRGNATLARALGTRRLQRAIGVVYVPQDERRSHYFHARLARQFDAVVHLDRTRAVTPLADRSR